MLYWLGVDCGTGGIRAVVLGQDGNIRAVSFAQVPLSAPRPLFAAQRPQDWWEGARQAIRGAVAQAGVPIAAIGVTGQMLGSVLLDEAGDALPEAIIWMDQRAAAQRDELARQMGDEILSITANGPLSSLWAPKLLWLRHHEPETFRRIAGLLFPKDYIKYRLTGIRDIDVTDAGGSMLFDTNRRQWSETLFARLGLPRAWVPERASESTDIIGGLLPGAAADLGLYAGTPVVSGAGDQMAAAISAGAVTPGVVSISLGTSGVVFGASPRCIVDRQDRAALSYCHAAPGLWCLFGCTMAAGASYQWLRDKVFPDLYYPEMDALAAAVPAGSGGTVFLPYLHGERTPHPDPNARGLFFGLTAVTGRGELCRAVLEGVAFSLRDCVCILNEYGIPATQVRVGGGGARSALWRQILADVLGARVLTTQLDEGPAAGAAMLAAVGTGAYASLADACSSLVHITAETVPEPDATVRYGELYRVYRALYPAMQPLFTLAAEEEARRTTL